MRIGLFTVGLGGAAYPDVIRAVAETSERVGVATLWAAEHVVLFDRYDSAYPYSPSGAFPLGADADWLDPFVALTFAAAVTSRIRLATGICLVPEHNPSSWPRPSPASTASPRGASPSGSASAGRPRNSGPSAFPSSAAPGARASTSRSCASSGAPGWRATRASCCASPTRVLSEAGPGRPRARHLRRRERAGPAPRGRVRRRLVRLQPRPGIGSREDQDPRAISGRQRPRPRRRRADRRPVHQAHRPRRPGALPRSGRERGRAARDLAPSPAEAVTRIERFAREWIEPAARR